MQKTKKKLVLRRDTLRELNRKELGDPVGGGGSKAGSTDPSNAGCCCPTDATITCQTHKCI
jgi:hypothetical protein